MSIRKELFKLCDELFEKKNENTKEMFRKKSALLFASNDLSTNIWYLYQINLSTKEINDNQLGFIVPSELLELPIINDGFYRIKIVSKGTINYKEHDNLFQLFSKHIFEHVFDSTNFEFNLQSSTFKLLPCLLTNSNKIDFNRMLTICDRHRKAVERPSLLSNTELYTVWYLPTKSLFISLSNVSQIKRASDRKTGNESYAEFYEKLIPNVRIERELIMGSMKAINKRKISLNIHDDSIKSSDQTIYYYPIELLHYAPLNQSDFQLISKLPSILVRIVQIYHIEKLRKLFAESIKSYSLIKSTEICFKDCLTDYMQIVSLINLFPENSSLFLLVSLNHLNYDFSIRTNEQPSTDILFQATTRRSTAEQFDMENFEILGDCFLKFSVSMSLYYQYPSADVGQLTLEKIKEISNENLYRLTVENKLKNYLYTDKIILQGNDANWLPPGYIVKTTDSSKYVHQKVKRKAFADMIEALIGAFLISSNYITTIQFMHWLGLNTIPSDFIEVSERLDGDEARRIFRDERFEEIEITLNYVFRNKAYLIAAFTHPSRLKNGVVYSYERLEFLGDALLDLLVVRHTFLNYERDLTPGRVTDIRQALSNNNRLAYILVSSNLHRKIRYQSNVISEQMKSYLSNKNLFPSDQSTRDIHQWLDSIAAPKIFADVFEALIAAIFFDSGNSLEVVWKVIEPFLGKFMNRSIIDPKLNVFRTFSNQGGKILAEFTDEKGSVCLVQMPDGTSYEGHGTNKKLAKSDACRQALNLE